LCQSRLEENLIPACITLCPTDALQLGIFEHKNIITDISGFTATTIGPSIKIKPLRKGQELPEQSALPFDSEISEKFRSVHKSQADKVNLKNEWPLVTFTILMPLLYGLFTLSVLNKSFLPSGIISIAGIIGFALSALHLGKPLRAFRAIFNIRSSWLSREILGYSVFLFLIFTKELQLINNHFFDLTVILIGAFTLISTDIVYTVIPQTRINRWHSALVFPTGLLYLALFSEYLGLLFFILGIKLYLFLYRKKHYNKILSVLSLFRIGLGFVVPVILVILNPADVIMLMFVFVILAEILDRFDFYLELDIITPKKQMQLDYDKNFRTLTSGNN
jgi:DMSO reductase anchor subunit